jgi:hypothetical protein
MQSVTLPYHKIMLAALWAVRCERRQRAYFSKCNNWIYFKRGFAHNLSSLMKNARNLNEMSGQQMRQKLEDEIQQQKSNTADRPMLCLLFQGQFLNHSLFNLKGCYPRKEARVTVSKYRLVVLGQLRHNLI